MLCHISNDSIKGDGVPIFVFQEADGISFSGIGSEGEHLFIRMIRRLDGRKEVCIDVHLNDGSSYSSYEEVAAPSRRQQEQQPSTQNCTWIAPGVKITCAEPMRRWRILYNGMLRLTTHFIYCLKGN